jgi:NAD-dependent dihydropyrimidine dehydrogenase PreA subunit
MTNNIVLIDEKLCTGCGRCVNMCPKQILYLDRETRKCRVTDEKKGDRLGGCMRACPVKAIKID